MRNIGEKIYFDIIFSVGMCIIIGLTFIGQVVFITLGLIFGIADWGIEGVFAIGFGIFGLFIGNLLILFFLCAFSYYKVDEDGVTNGNIFGKRKIKFCESDRWDVRREGFASLLGLYVQDCFCLHKGRKLVKIPIYGLEKEEIEWLKAKASAHSKINSN